MSGPHHPLQPEFEKFVPADLAGELVRQYVRLKNRAWSGDNEGVQESGGKVAELALRAAQHLAGEKYTPLHTEIKNVPAVAAKLEQVPKTQADDSVRIVIPRVIATLYTVRNKRSGGHTASEVDPSRSDALLTERMADWLMAEIFRLGNALPLDQAEAAIEALVQRRLPVVYTTGSYRRVLKKGLGPRAEIMILLYAESGGATVPELLRWMRIPRSSLGRYVRQLEDERLLRTEREGRTVRVFLLPTGERQVEDERWLEPE